jgi:hypothetical protein
MAGRVDRGVAGAKEGNPRQGRMTNHRRIVLAGTVVAALMIGTPMLAAASPLLSGYGGPGQGSQQILGAALLGGGSGGASGGGGSTGGKTGGSSGSSRYGERPAESESESESSGNGAVGANATKGGGGAAPGHPGSGSGSRGTGAGETSGGGASAYPASPVEQASVATPVGAQTLGLSGDDLLLVLLALAALAFTGFLTRRLARTGEPGSHRPLKGRAAGPE